MFALWNLCTLGGALLGDALGDPRRYGLDAAAAAAFLALVWPRLTGPHGRSARLVAGLAVVVALATTPVLPAGVPVLLAAASAIVVGMLTPVGAPDAPPSAGPGREGHP